MKNIIDALNWRYATKQYDTTKKLSAEQLNMLTEAVRLSPSSFGLQAWKFFVISNPEIRAKLREAAYGQSPVTDASQIIVFAASKNLGDAEVDVFVADIAKTRGIPKESLAEYEKTMKGSIAMRTPEGRTEWAARQLYIALGVLLTTAAVNEIDATPMEGFDPKKFDEILGLSAMGFESKVMAAVGFRAETDMLAKAAKVRFPKDQVVVELR